MAFVFLNRLPGSDVDELGHCIRLIDEKVFRVFRYADGSYAAVHSHNVQYVSCSKVVNVNLVCVVHSNKPSTVG